MPDEAVETGRVISPLALVTGRSGGGPLMMNLLHSDTSAEGYTLLDKTRAKVEAALSGGSKSRSF